MSGSPLRCVAPDPGLLAEYQRLTRDCGVIDFSDRTQLELRGPDRHRFLHNLCTNDIQRLQPGQGCEAFVTTVQGRCLGHVFAFAGPESLVVETSPGQAELLLTHLDRYLITDDVQLIDRSQDWGELLLAGPGASPIVEALLTDGRLDADCAHQPLKVDSIDAWVRRVPMTGQPTFLVAARRADLSRVQAMFQEQGAALCRAAAFHMARIEHGFPWYSWDISERNLPQEVDRDEVAISFRKGCYLGQETVARIDALGHVNRVLVAVRGPRDEVPAEGTGLSFAGKAVGEVTSAAFSPRLDAPLALAYVRCEHRQPGTKLTLSEGSAEVISLPLSND